MQFGGDDGGVSEAMAKVNVQGPSTKMTKEQYQAMMANPEYNNMMKGMTVLSQSDDFKAKMEEIKNDPEMKKMFANVEQSIKKKGLAGIQDAIKKYYNNEEFLKKIGSAVGDIPAKAMAAA